MLIFFNRPHLNVLESADIKHQRYYCGFVFELYFNCYHNRETFGIIVVGNHDSHICV